jgi:hypothetical protein
MLSYTRLGYPRLGQARSSQHTKRWTTKGLSELNKNNNCPGFFFGAEDFTPLRLLLPPPIKNTNFPANHPRNIFSFTELYC